MELFYIPDILHSEAILKGEELHHITRVLRKGIGDAIHFTYGQGGCYQGVIDQAGKHEARVLITDHQFAARTSPRITIATALTKNMKRMEWAFEKMTELGVHRVVPLICARSERLKMNRARVQKILISAMKQSERLFLPELTAPQLVKQVMASHEGAAGYLATRSPESVPLGAHYKAGSDVVILIGPEGDFTEDEMESARNAGWTPVHFGSQRLRTETAAVFAVAAIAALNTV